MNDNALLKNKGRLWVFDERAAVKAWTEIALVDNVRITHPANPVEVKSPSGITVYRTLDLDSMLEFDLYHPGDNSVLELLYRGVIDLTEYDGATAQNEVVSIKFRNASEAYPLPGFDGDKGAVTVNSVKSSDLATTYSLTTDYTVAVDSVTGISMIVQVSGGSIPVGEEVIVDYDFTPLESKVLRPNFGADLVDRHLLVTTFVDCDDLTKYRTYYLPRATATSDLQHSLLETGEDNTNVAILPVKMELAKPDACGKEAKWAWYDTVVI